MRPPSFCTLCNRHVGVRRHIGVGTLLACLATAGVWIAAIPFYKLRCSICGSAAIGVRPEDVPRRNWGAWKADWRYAVKVLGIVVAVVLGLWLIAGSPLNETASTASQPAVLPLPTPDVRTKAAIVREKAAAIVVDTAREHGFTGIEATTEGHDYQTIRVKGPGVRTFVSSLAGSKSARDIYRDALLGVGFTRIAYEYNGRQYIISLMSGKPEAPFGGGRARRSSRETK